MFSSDITADEYEQQIELSAREILDECEEYSDFPSDSSRFEDEVTESVDTTASYHEWTTWNHNFLQVLTHAENDPGEWYSFVEPGEKSHWAVLQAMAREAFRADLYEAAMDELRSRREREIAA